MSEPNKAVFLSYASQDAKAARCICEAFRAAGIEVWFDQSELRGGDSWDRQIRKQIHDCALFIPIISVHAQSRLEGYFRREWKLAADRTHDMAEEKAFVVPVVIDDTSERSAIVPDKFREVQWTHLPAGVTSPTFVERVSRLLAQEAQSAQSSATPPAVPSPGAGPASKKAGAGPLASWRPRNGVMLIALVVSIGIGYLAVENIWLPKRVAVGTVLVAAVAPDSPAQNAIPEKSIAVLPFVDMSEKHDQEYFSDGLSEELIDLLTKVPNLRVPARTSSFYFKGKSEDIATIAQKLRVTHVLEGSVRKAGDRLRITAQLILASNGYHLWSNTYDRDAKDVFKVQDEIAGSVVKALSVSLFKTSVAQGAKTSNSAAYTLYLQGRSRFSTGNSLSDEQDAIAILEQASKLDPGFAPTWATLSRVRLNSYLTYGVGSIKNVRAQALTEVDRAIAIDPESSEGHVVRGHILMALDWDWVGAEREIEKALEFGRANADVLRNASYFSNSQGNFDEAVSRLKTATELDPLSFYNYMRLGNAEEYSGNLSAAEVSYRTAIVLRSNVDELHSDLALVLLAQGKFAEAMDEIDREPDPIAKALTLPIVLSAVGRAAEAKQALAETESKYGDKWPYWIGLIYASGGDLTHALVWWQRAFDNRDSNLGSLIKTAPRASRHPQLAEDPRYKALLRKMHLPE